MEKIKAYLIEVGIKKIIPSAIRGAILGISGWFLMKRGVFSSYGIISDPVARTTTISWNQLNSTLIVVVPGLIAALIKTINHETMPIVSKSLAAMKSDGTPPPASPDAK